MSEVTVREASAGDADAVRRVAERGWHAAYCDILDEGTIDAAVAKWYAPEATRASIERADVAYFVAERGGDVVGYLSGGPSGEEGVAVLAAVYVDPERWGEGTGTALLERFEAFCRREGYETVTFRVLAGNDVGSSFYRTHGYEAVAEEETVLFGESAREVTFRGAVE